MGGPLAQPGVGTSASGHALDSLSACRACPRPGLPVSSRYCGDRAPCQLLGSTAENLGVPCPVSEWSPSLRDAGSGVPRLSFCGGPRVLPVKMEGTLPPGYTELQCSCLGWDSREAKVFRKCLLRQGNTFNSWATVKSSCRGADASIAELEEYPSHCAQA